MIVAMAPEDGMCALRVDGSTYLIDTLQYEPGALCAMLYHDGSIKIGRAERQQNTNCFGARSALSPPRRDGRIIVRDGVVVLGRVVACREAAQPDLANRRESRMPPRLARDYGEAGKAWEVPEMHGPAVGAS